MKKNCCCHDHSDFKGPYTLKPQAKPVVLCMCGHSKNKPFCDGTHLKLKEIMSKQDCCGEKECCGGHDNHSGCC